MIYLEWKAKKMTETKKKIEVSVTSKPVSAEIVCRQYEDYTDVRFRAKSEEAADLLLIKFFLQLPESKRKMLRNINEDDPEVEDFIDNCEKKRRILH